MVDLRQCLIFKFFHGSEIVVEFIGVSATLDWSGRLFQNWLSSINFNKAAKHRRKPISPTKQLTKNTALLTFWIGPHRTVRATRPNLVGAMI